MLKLPIIVYQLIKYLTPKIWHLVPDQIKHCGSLTKFKHFIKSWSSRNYRCRLCKRYIAQVGFIRSRITMKLGASCILVNIFVVLLCSFGFL